MPSTPSSYATIKMFIKAHPHKGLLLYYYTILHYQHLPEGMIHPWMAG